MDMLTIKEFIKDSLKFLIIIFILMFLMINVISITQVIGSSMAPTLENGEVLILNKAKYKISNIKRGDIIAFAYEDTKYLIKRVIGIPGDYISIKNNKIYINGKYYEENNLKKTNTKDFELASLGYTKIPQNMYFVLGDNRNNSLDSRKIGLVNKKDIVGKIFIKIWPINKFKIF